MAHPHAYIDLQTTVIFDKDGQVTAIREHWLFDQFYTEFALHDFAYKKDGALDHDKLMALANENLKGLKDFSYFTYFNAPKPALGEARDVDSSLQKGQIAMEFTLQLDKPVKPPISFRIYDPSYYTAMVHVQDRPVILQNAPTSCHAVVITPKPAAAWKNMAQALDKNATGPDDLGTYFAETVKIACKG